MVDGYGLVKHMFIDLYPDYLEILMSIIESYYLVSAGNHHYHFYYFITVFFGV